MKEDKTTRTFELIACLILGSFSILMIGYALLHPTGGKNTGMKSYTFPIVIYSMMLLSSLVILIRNRLTDRRERAACCAVGEELTEEERIRFTYQKTDRRILLTVGLIFLYVAMWKVVGFTISSLAFVAVEAKLLRKESSWKQCAAVSVAAGVILYVVFVKLFSINLPETFLANIL